MEEPSSSTHIGPRSFYSADGIDTTCLSSSLQWNTLLSAPNKEEHCMCALKKFHNAASNDAIYHIHAVAARAAVRQPVRMSKCAR